MPWILRYRTSLIKASSCCGDPPNSKPGFCRIERLKSAKLRLVASRFPVMSSMVREIVAKVIAHLAFANRLKKHRVNRINSIRHGHNYARNDVRGKSHVRIYVFGTIIGIPR